MVAAFIFIVILATFMSVRRDQRRRSLILFALSMLFVTLLFLHHATDTLGLSF